MKAPTLYRRIKSVDLDGTAGYSKTVMVAGTCAGKWALTLFPNPVADASLLTVMAKEGMFDGRYKVSVISAAGQLVKQNELTLHAAKTFPLFVTGISAGKYPVKIESANGGATDMLEFEKR